MRLILVAGLAVITLTAPATATAGPHATSCDRLRFRAVEQVLDYGLARASEGPLASAPDITVDMIVERCRPITRHRARWQYSLVITDETTSTRLADERGTVMITRHRAVWQLTP